MAHLEERVTYDSFEIDDAGSLAALLEHDDRRSGHPASDQGLMYKRSERRAWSFFITACLISLIISTFNFTRLSLSVSFPQQHATPTTTLKTPSVYLGLERVQVDPSYCRSRGTFPKEFSVVRDDDVTTRQRVHAPDDKVQFAFGGNVSFQLRYALLETIFILSFCSWLRTSSSTFLTSVWRTVQLHSNSAMNPPRSPLAISTYIPSLTRTT